MNFEKINNSQWDMNYASVSFVIQWINSTGHLDIVDMGWSKNLILRRLTAVIKTQFISPTNQIYEKYLVKNTTVKERKRLSYEIKKFKEGTYMVFNNSAF